MYLTDIITNQQYLTITSNWGIDTLCCNYGKTLLTIFHNIHLLFVIISSKTAEMKNYSSVLIILDKKINEILKFIIRKKFADRRKKFTSEAFGTHRYPVYPPQFFS